MKKIITLLLIIASLMASGQSVSTSIKTDKIYSKIGRGIKLYDTTFLMKAASNAPGDIILGLIGRKTTGELIFVDWDLINDSLSGVGGYAPLDSILWMVSGSNIQNKNAGNVLISKSLALPQSTSTIGQIIVGDSTYFHSKEYTSTFFGHMSGNHHIDNGYSNTGFGYGTLRNTNSGTIYNSAFGYEALYANTGGYWNSAFGSQALYSNLTGISNNAFGHNALVGNVDGSGNSAFGEGCLEANVDGNGNTGFGAQIFLSNVNGNENTGIGYNVFTAIEGSSNIGIGYEIGFDMQTGNNCIIIGDSATATDNVDYQLNIGDLITGIMDGIGKQTTLNGDIYLPELDSTVTTNSLYYNSTTNKVTFGAELSGGGGQDLIAGYGLAGDNYNGSASKTWDVDTNDLSLNVLDDVTLTTPDQGDLLMLNETNQWINWTPNFLTSEVDGSITNEIEVVDEAYGSANFNGGTTSAVSQDDFYDYQHIGDTDDDGKADLLDTQGADLDMGENDIHSADTISADDAIGIGTDNPTQPLHIKFDKTIGGILLENNNTADGRCLFDLKTGYTANAGDYFRFNFRGNSNADVVQSIYDASAATYKQLLAFKYLATNPYVVFGANTTSGSNCVGIFTGGLSLNHTTVPTTALDINSATGANMRFIYNDSDGSPSNYVDFKTSSGGDLTVTTSGNEMYVESNLVVSGTFAVPITTLTADKTLDNRHHTILADNSSATGTNRLDITLPTASGCPGRIYIIKCYAKGGSGDVYGFTINASRIYLTHTEYAATYDFDIEGGSVTIQSNGSDWHLIDWSGTITGW